VDNNTPLFNQMDELRKTYARLSRKKGKDEDKGTDEPE
jgi:hypothetical protein